MFGTALTESVAKPSASQKRRLGTVANAPVLAVSDFALANGLSVDQVENAIGMSLGRAMQAPVLPAHVGPALFKTILEAGIGDAPPLQIARNAPFSFFSGLERTIVLAPTARDAQGAFASNFVVFHDTLEARLEETNRFVAFSFRTPFDEIDNGCCNDLVLGVLLRLLRSVFGRYANPVETRFRYDPNGKREIYEGFVGSPLEFSSSCRSHALIFRRSDMEWSQPGHDPELFRICNSRLSSIASSRRSNPTELLFLELANAAYMCASMGQFSVEAVSATAGIGERTAQRLAQKNGSSVGRLIEQARLRILREQLSKNRNINTEDLAQLAGFSDSRALRRALKSWTNLTLTQFRSSPFQRADEPYSPGERADDQVRASSV